MGLGEVIVSLFAILMICVTVIIIFAPKEIIEENKNKNKNKKK